MGCLLDIGELHTYMSVRQRVELQSQSHGDDSRNIPASKRACPPLLLGAKNGVEAVL